MELLEQRGLDGGGIAGAGGRGSRVRIAAACRTGARPPTAAARAAESDVATYVFRARAFMPGRFTLTSSLWTLPSSAVGLNPGDRGDLPARPGVVLEIGWRTVVVPPVTKTNDEAIHHQRRGVGFKDFVLLRGLDAGGYGLTYLPTREVGSLGDSINATCGWRIL